MKHFSIRLSWITFIVLWSWNGFAADATSPCLQAIHRFNEKLAVKIDAQELYDVMQTLQTSGNSRLPAAFVTKKQARNMGWTPGQDLWKIEKLKGKSIGGDLFRNLEGRLPAGRRVWHEADLDYKGGHRNAKRLLYSSDGLRFVTVDHYKTFIKAPPCP